MPQGGTNFGDKQSPVEHFLTNTAGNWILVRSLAANIPSGAAGYSVGCLLESADTGVTYSNTGTITSCTFTASSSASVLTLPSSFTDATVNTTQSFGIVADSLTTGAAIKISIAGATSGKGVLVTASTANFTTSGALFKGDMVAATAGNGLVIVTTGAYTGTGLATLTAGAMTSGVGLSVVSTTGLTTGSLIRATSSTAGAIATNGAISLVATGAFTTTASTLGFVHVAGASTVSGTIMSILGGAQTTGIALNITDPSAGMTSGSLLRIISATAGAVATNGIVSIQGSGAFTGTAGLLNVSASASVAGTLVSFSGVNTTSGNMVNMSNNALTVGSGTLLNLSHTTSVLGAGTSMLRITSTGIDTGTTTGTLLDLAQSANVGNTAVLLTDSSADTAARIGIKVAVTNAAAVLALPLQISNVAVNSTHFVKMTSYKNGATVITLWLSDATDPNGALSGTAGDICYNGASNKPAYCTGTTNWTNFV